jgi:hypothetical protein
MSQQQGVKDEMHNDTFAQYIERTQMSQSRVSESTSAGYLL